MNLDSINTDERSVPTIISASATKLSPGRYDHRPTKEYQIYLNWHPTGESMYENTEGKYFKVCAASGDLLILPPYIHHIDTITDNDFDYDGYLIYLTFPDFVLTDRLEIIKSSAKLRALIDQFGAEWEKQLPGYRIRCGALLMNLFEELRVQSESKYRNSAKYRLIEPAIKFIHEKYRAGGITIEKLASLCGVTGQHFHRTFLSCTGTTPGKYIEALRMKAVRELLVSGRYTVAAAANECGYDSASNFARSFRAYFGMPPSEVMPSGGIRHRGNVAKR